MRIGLMLSVIDFERTTDEVNEFNEQGQQWVKYCCNVRAEKTRSSGNENDERSGEFVSTSHIFKTHYFHGVEERDRIIQDGNVYEIVDIDNFRDMNKELHIYTRKVSRKNVTGF